MRATFQTRTVSPATWTASAPRIVGEGTVVRTTTSRSEAAALGRFAKVTATPAVTQRVMVLA